MAEARRRATEAGLAGRVRFEVASALDLPDAGYALVTYFDALHDLGDPLGALRAARAALAPGGAVLVCDFDAADELAANLHPAGRMYYAVSALVCTPNALSQAGPDSAEPLGTFAGAARIADVARAAGLTRVRRLQFRGRETHLPHAKGLVDLTTLLAAPGREVHVLTLLGRPGEAAGADPVLDGAARRSYRARVSQLRDVLDGADAAGDETASRAAAEELAALTRELSAATGLGGRDRRLGDEVERARKAVSARLHDTLSRIAEADPELGAHLAGSLTIGTRCCYRPAEPVDWLL